MKVFNKYETAFEYARAKAKELNLDYGLFRANEFGRTVWQVFILPRINNRFGKDAQAQVVTPNEF